MTCGRSAAGSNSEPTGKFSSRAPLPDGVSSAAATVPGILLIPTTSTTTMRYSSRTDGSAPPQGIRRARSAPAAHALEQTGVAIGVESVARPDRLGVGGLDALEPGERGDQHEQRRARQVEVG